MTPKAKKTAEAHAKAGEWIASTINATLTKNKECHVCKALQLYVKELQHVGFMSVQLASIRAILSAGHPPPEDKVELAWESQAEPEPKP